MSQTSLNEIGSDVLRKSTRNRRFASHYTRPARFSTHENCEGLDRKKLFSIRFLTTQNRDDACHKRRSIKFGSRLLRISSRNRRFYSHYTRPARVSTMRTAKVWIEKIVIDSLFNNSES